jgi:hypothetical protein
MVASRSFRPGLSACKPLCSSFSPLVHFIGARSGGKHPYCLSYSKGIWMDSASRDHPKDH